jgi:hypothetical protein
MCSGGEEEEELELNERARVLLSALLGRGSAYDGGSGWECGWGWELDGTLNMLSTTTGSGSLAYSGLRRCGAVTAVVPTDVGRELSVDCVMPSVRTKNAFVVSGQS